jgi:hypothetical protein
MRISHDPDTIRLFGLMLKPTVWQADAVYLKSDANTFDVVIPTEFTGFYYGVDNPGISGATEPTWLMNENELTEDGTKGLIWKTYLYDLLPVDLSITAVTVTPTNGVTVSGVTFADGSVDWTIDVIVPTATARTNGEFDILAHMTLSNGETLDRTLNFKVVEN